MKILEYLSPEGDLTYNVNTDNLSGIILSPRSDYWCAGNGEGCFTWYKAKNSSSIISNIYLNCLVLTFYEKYGFWLQYKSQNPGAHEYTSIGDGDFNHENAVEVYICGDPLLLPSAYFISPIQALIAVKEFVKTANKSEEIQWRSKGEDG
jgi:hypothetical protein